MSFSRSRSVDDLSALGERKFFLRNIPEGWIAGNLYKIFGKFGQVQQAWIVPNKRTGCVMMHSSEGAEKLRWSLVHGVLKTGAYNISVEPFKTRSKRETENAGRRRNRSRRRWATTRDPRGKSCEPSHNNCGGGASKTPRQKNRVQNQEYSYWNDGKRFGMQEQQMTTSRRGRSCESRRNKLENGMAKQCTHVQNQESSCWNDRNRVDMLEKQKAGQSADDHSALGDRKFFLHNIPQGFLAGNLYNIFGKFGRVKQAWIVANKRTGCVMMQSSEGAEKLRWSLVNGALKTGAYNISVEPFKTHSKRETENAGRRRSRSRRRRSTTRDPRGKSCEPSHNNCGGGGGSKTPRQKNHVQNQENSYWNDSNRFGMQEQLMTTSQTPRRRGRSCDPRRNKKENGKAKQGKESSYWNDRNRQESRRDASKPAKKASAPQNSRSARRSQRAPSESPRRPPNQAGRRPSSQWNHQDTSTMSHLGPLITSGSSNSASAHPGTPRRQQTKQQNQITTPTTSRRSQKKQQMIIGTPTSQRSSTRREYSSEMWNKEMDFALTPMRESGIKEFQQMCQFPPVPLRKPSSSIGTQTRTDMEELEMLFLTPPMLMNSGPKTCSKGTQVSPSRTARRTSISVETQTEMDLSEEDDSKKKKMKMKKKPVKKALAHSVMLRKRGGTRFLGEEEKKAREKAMKKKYWDALQKQMQMAKCYSPVDLPMGKECKVVVVESPWAIRRSQGFTFNVVNVSSKTHRDKKYKELQRLMNLHCKQENNAIAEVDRVKIGDPLLFFYENVAFRAVKIDEDEVFLVDIGSTEHFKPGQVFHMQHEFFTLPTLVTECTLANVSWLVTKVEELYILRNLVYRWCEAEKWLTVTAKGYRRCLNLVELRSPRFDLTKSLMKRGWVKMAAEDEGRAYSREEIRSFQPEPSATVSKKVLEKIRFVEGVQKKK